MCEIGTDDSRPISLKVQAEDGTASSAKAVSIGLIVWPLRRAP